MRILLADAFPDAGQQALRDRGHDVRFEPGLDESTLVESIGDAEALIVRSTKVTAATMDAATDLSLIVRAGAGTNTIDLDAAGERGIYVCNTPGRNAVAVAELALGLLLAIDRNIADNVADLRAGTWDKKRYSKAEGIAGRTLGIVGVGDIGIALASRATACGMRVLAVSKDGRDTAVVERAERAGIHWVADMAWLASSVDVLSFHVPAAPSTKGMCGTELLAHLKPGAIVINTSRGDVVDEDALLAAIEEKGLRAGLDVYAEEPGSGTGEFINALAQHPNVYGTHHIGASTEQAQAAIAAEVLEVIGDYSRGILRHCVNLEQEPAGAATLVIRHRNEVGALSAALLLLKKAAINIAQMDNELFTGGKTACATLRINQPLDDETLAALRDLPQVVGASCQPSS